MNKKVELLSFVLSEDGLIMYVKELFDDTTSHDYQIPFDELDLFTKSYLPWLFSRQLVVFANKPNIIFNGEYLGNDNKLLFNKFLIPAELLAE